MRKRIGIICLTVGAVLVLSALLLFIYNRYTDTKAGENAEVVLDGVKEAIALTDENTDVSEPVADNATPSDMPTVEIDGNLYIGYLSIPALNIELPVIDKWEDNYDLLNIAPCRHFGSVYTDDIVIAGHNYTSHFAYLSDLSKGHTIIFTDMNGVSVTYSIEEFKVVNPEDIDSVKNSGYDLVLYTCTYSGSTRFTVFANRIEE